MTENPSILMRLFDESEPVASAIVGDEAAAAIATNGTGYRLYTAEQLLMAAPSSTFASLPGTRVVTATGKAAPGAEPPDFESMPSTDGIFIGEDFVGSDLERYVHVHFAPSTTILRLARTRWRCDPHGEVYVRASGGKCPRHANGTLKRVAASDS